MNDRCNPLELLLRDVLNFFWLNWCYDILHESIVNGSKIETYVSLLDKSLSEDRLDSSLESSKLLGHSKCWFGEICMIKSKRQ